MGTNNIDTRIRNKNKNNMGCTTSTMPVERRETLRKQSTVDSDDTIGALPGTFQFIYDRQATLIKDSLVDVTRNGMRMSIMIREVTEYSEIDLNSDFASMTSEIQAPVKPVACPDIEYESNSLKIVIPVDEKPAPEPVKCLKKRTG